MKHEVMTYCVSLYHGSIKVWTSPLVGWNAVQFLAEGLNKKLPAEAGIKIHDRRGSDCSILEKAVAPSAIV